MPSKFDPSHKPRERLVPRILQEIAYISLRNRNRRICSLPSVIAVQKSYIFFYRRCCHFWLQILLPNEPVMKNPINVMFSVKVSPHRNAILCSMPRLHFCGWSAALVLGAMPLFAAPDDELIGEQVAYNNLSRETEKSFWDPSFWRNLTHPLETPIVPTDTHFLYFGVKDPTGQSYALPAENFRLYTAARLGFAPPPVTPSFSSVNFNADKIVFDGTPDVPATPVGRFNVATDEWLEVLSGSEIDFDRTIVEADNTRIHGASLTFSGDVSSYNFRSLGNVGILRSGLQTIPSLKLRTGAIAEIASFVDSFVPAGVPGTNITAVAIESGGHFHASSVQLFTPGGNVFDASAGRGRATLGSLVVDGNAPEVDPAVLFHATGVASPVSAFSVTNNTVLSGFCGVLAQIEDGATMNFNNIVYALGTGGKMGLRANREGAITMYDLRSTTTATSGSTQLDWLATTQGSIALTQLMSAPLHLNDQVHVISASSGGTIDIPTSLGIDTAGSLSLTSSGAGSKLGLDGYTEFTPHNYLSESAARWSDISLNITAGGLLQGGETRDFGSGYYSPDVRSLYIHKTTSMNDLTVTGGSMKNIGLAFFKAPVDCELGSPGSPATLNQVSINIGDGSTLIMRGGTWQPERVEMADTPQGLQVGDSVGGSSATITDAAVCHSLDLTAGFGFFGLSEETPPVVTNSIITIQGNSTVTGSLSAAQFYGGKGSINISGTSTRCGFRNAQLGAVSNPSLGTQSGGGGLIGFTGEFFSVLGGESSLNVTAGARVAIGAFAGAYGQWRQPDSFNPAYLSANATPITIDATSAIYLGDAADALTQDFRPGALVVGPGGYMIGTGTVSGAAAGGNDLVIAGGYISPGFSPGSMTVNGNFLMESGTLVLEVKSGSPGEWDSIIADAITINGGTIIIRPAADYASGAGIAVDFFQTANLTIAPGVTIQIAPELGSTVFDAATGMISIVGGSENDLNENSIDDRLEAVLPAIGNLVEFPSLQYAPGSPAVFRFRRKDSSRFGYNLVVQWSEDLISWTDIQVPYSSFEEIQITENEDDPDLIEVTLPSPGGVHPRIFARLAVTKSSFGP